MKKAMVVPAALAAGIAFPFTTPVAHAVPPECQQYVGPDSMGNDQSALLQGCINDWNAIHGTAPAAPGASQPPAAGGYPCPWGTITVGACADCVVSHGSADPCWGPSPTAPPRTASAPSGAPPAVSNQPARVPTSGPPVRMPQDIQASPEAVQSAKQNVSQVDPANPPKSPSGKDVPGQVQDAINHHHADVVKGHICPRHWEYTDQDGESNPRLVNPTSEGTTFRYFYQGSYQEAYVEAGSSISLTGVSGVFPFTAVSNSNLASGIFYGGTPPAVDRNVAAYVPAYNQTVQIGTVQIIGHDDTQPAGEQDAMMLNGTTLARGQANNPSDGGQVTVAKTQTLPGVGPTDDGKSLVDLAAASQGHGMNKLVPIGLAALVLAAGIWLLRRKQRATR